MSSNTVSAPPPVHPRDDIAPSREASNGRHNSLHPSAGANNDDIRNNSNSADAANAQQQQQQTPSNISPVTSPKRAIRESPSDADMELKRRDSKEHKTTEVSPSTNRTDGGGNTTVPSKEPEKDIEEEEDEEEEDEDEEDEDEDDMIDWNIFGQILEMDEDEEEREFSRSILLNFFEQADATFQQMDVALKGRNLSELYSLGHFLKGSSAALGLIKVKNSCEEIQHAGDGDHRNISGYSSQASPNKIGIQGSQSPSTASISEQTRVSISSAPTSSAPTPPKAADSSDSVDSTKSLSTDEQDVLDRVVGYLETARKDYNLSKKALRQYYDAE